VTVGTTRRKLLSARTRIAAAVMAVVAFALGYLIHPNV
jgi:hypothetical protein